MSEIKQPFAFTDQEQYPTSDLVRIIREGEAEIAITDIPRQRQAIDFMVKCAVFEYHQRKYADQ